VYPTLGDDEWCAIAVQGDEQWRAFCDAIGEPELATDQRFSAHDARKRHEDDLDAVIVAWTAARDRWEVADLLQELGIAAAAVENLRDVLEVDPQLRDHFQHVSEPSKPDADMLIDGEAIRFVGVDRPLTQAPALGEDNEHVLCEIVGLSREQFDALVVEGVIN
jgi:crotonobetainyl-CoA:carnitine CoA-transferase CaiB-like acyl-CoA transferase